MKEAEKKQIEELLKCLTYSTKTRNLAYNRKGETTFTQGSCIPRFKNDFKKLLNSFKIDPPEMSEAERKGIQADRMQVSCHPHGESECPSCVGMQDLAGCVLADPFANKCPTGQESVYGS